MQFTNTTSLDKPAIEQLRVVGWSALVALNPKAAVDVMATVMGVKLTQKSALAALRAARAEQCGRVDVDVTDTVADFLKSALDQRGTGTLHRLMTRRRVWTQPDPTESNS